MNRHGMVLLGLLGLLGCGSPVSEQRALLQAGYAQNHRGGEAFQGTRWGMTPDEVRALHPEAQPTTRGDLFMPTELAGLQGMVLFVFTEGHLGNVLVRFTETFDVRQEHKVLVDAMVAKYGRPRGYRTLLNADASHANRRKVGTDLSWPLAFFTDTLPQSRPGPGEPSPTDVVAVPPDAVARADGFVRRLHALVTATWRTEETSVYLMGGEGLNEGRSERMLTLHYEGRDFAQVIRADVFEDIAARRRAQADAF
ncbi:hypothetical protein [Corallococcus sp. EGB]|uniref:hypothetical protein n=1 Tax=Corallococcus sp. EGB TaxID=1521117 RepID=UPI001CBEB82F|nr:hypothetical protein [Corallococcus sp. EGB]